MITSEKKIFIGDYDSYTITKADISFEYLVRLTKTALLLFDRILLPAAFFWQSENMSRLIPLVEDCIRSGYILPMIRDRETTYNVHDYFERRLEESSKQKHLEVFLRPELKSELAEKTDKRIALELNDNTYAYVDKKSIREVYAENWKKDIDYNHDICSIHFLLLQSDMPDHKINEVKSVLSAEAYNPYFSRAGNIQIIEKLLPDTPLRQKIISRASFLYLKSNADAYSSRFFLSDDSFNGMVFEDNILLLQRTLEVVGITNDLIDLLSMNDILQIKNSDEYRFFIYNYYELINKVYTAQSDVVDKVIDRMNSALRGEQLKSGAYKALNMIRNISSNVFLGLVANMFSGSPVGAPALIGFGATAGASSIAKVGRVNKFFSSTPFIDFKEHIQDNYKKMIDRKLGDFG